MFKSNTFEDGTLVVDTKNIQMLSLVAVMQEFGYWFDEDQCNFYDPENEYKRVSFKSAVELHNALEVMSWDITFTAQEGLDSFNHFDFTLYDFYRACGAQIVERVKLQLNKKKKHVFAQSNKITFTVPSYHHIFLDPKQ